VTEDEAGVPRPVLFDDADDGSSPREPLERQPESTSGLPPRSRRRGERARRRRRTWAVLGVLAVLILPFLLAGGWFVWQLNPPGGTGMPVTVAIEPGWGTQEAGDALQDAGVIGSSLAFQLWSTERAPVECELRFEARGR